jgi:hypothetical protein
MSKKDKALARAAAARQRGRLKKADFVKKHERAPSLVEKLYCRVCGDVVKELIMDENYIDTKTINGQVVKTVGLVLAESSEYAEIELTFDDGSTHVTYTCKKCAHTLTTDDLEDMYALDLELWNAEGAPEEFFAQYGSRKPLTSKVIRQDGGPV